MIARLIAQRIARFNPLFIQRKLGKFVAAAAKLVDDLRKGLGGLRSIAVGIVSVTVVQQDDRSRTGSLDRSFDDLVDAGRATIKNAERPADGSLAKGARDQ